MAACLTTSTFQAHKRADTAGVIFQRRSQVSLYCLLWFVCLKETSNSADIAIRYIWSGSSKPFMMYVNLNEYEFPPLLITDPTTGCPVGFDCVDGFGEPAAPVGRLCNDPFSVGMGYQCLAPPYFSDLIDWSNTGFCLRYTVS